MKKQGKKRQFDGKKLKIMLVTNDIPEKALAEHIGVTRSMLTQIIKNKKTPSLHKVIDIAEFLKIKIDDLLS